MSEEEPIKDPQKDSEDGFGKELEKMAQKIESQDKDVEEKKFTREEQMIATVFRHGKNGQERIQIIISKIQPYLDSRELAEQQISEIKNSLSGCVQIEDEKLFVEKVYSAVEPILRFIKENPQKSMEVRGNIPLNDVLSYGIAGNVVHIHADSFRKRPIEEGLQELAKIVEENKSLQIIEAKSWIVAKRPEWLEGLGFTDKGPISDEEKEKYFKGDNRPINRADISRKDFLERYLKNENGKK